MSASRAGLSLRGALSAAAGKASTTAENVITQGNLLVSAVRSLPGARLALGSKRRKLAGLVARDARSSHGRRFQVAGAGIRSTGEWVPEVDGLLNETRWELSRFRGHKPAYTDLPQWSPRAQRSVVQTLANASQAGVPHAGPLFLLDALLDDPECADLLSRCGVDPRQVREQAWYHTPEGAVDRPYTPMVQVLEGFRIVRGGPESVVLPAWGLKRLAKRIDVDLLTYVLETATTREAVRLGSGHVTTAHMLLAAAAVAEELTLAEADLPQRLALISRGGQLLAYGGVGWRELALGLARLQVTNETVLPHYSKAELKRRPSRWWRRHPRNPPWSQQAFEAAERAISAAAARDAEYGSTFLLLGALSEETSSARQLLHSLQVDSAAVLTAATDSSAG